LNYRPYLIAVLTTAAAIAVTRFTWPFFGGAPFAPLFGAVAATTHWGSGSAGLLAVLLGVIGAPLAFPATGPVPWHSYTLIGFVPVALIGSRIIAGRNQAVAALRASEAELRASEAELRAAWEVAKASEERVRRAQKMEAIGQLVAGVAHNFNNLMTVTMGYTDVLLESARGEEERDAALEIRKAAERGAALTRQLLAFGRMHDAKPARVNLGPAVAALRDMLTRVIRGDIQLTIQVESGDCHVIIDPYDLEQALLHLVVNARDALPAGGAIHIDVAREAVVATTPPDPAAPPGDYVRVRVRDNGVGMTPEVQSHMFEPFFTTKEVGEGTGLGLAFVHGIARHGDGFVTIESAPDEGTTVSLYLPPAPPEPL
jgi:signal transduction histidine kinase